MKARLKSEDYEDMAAFRYALRKFLRFSKQVLAKAELTPEQYEALLALKAFGKPGSLNIGELSEYLQVEHHTAVSLASKLVARGLIARKPGRLDRRQVDLRLTPAGAALLARLASVHRREIRSRSPEMMSALTRLQK